MSPKNEPLKTCPVGNEPYPSLIGKTNQISHESNIRKSFSDGYLDKTGTKCIRIFARQHPGRLDHIGRFFRVFQIIRALSSVDCRIFSFFLSVCENLVFPSLIGEDDLEKIYQGP